MSEMLPNIANEVARAEVEKLFDKPVIKNTGTIHAQSMDPIQPGNPFHSDGYNMGVRLGTNVYAMMSNFESQVCDYLIIVNTKTGERLRLTFSEGK